MDPSFEQTFLFFKVGLFETQIIELSDCNVLFALDIHEDRYQIVAQVYVGMQYLFFLRTIHNRHSPHPVDFIGLEQCEIIFKFSILPLFLIQKMLAESSVSLEYEYFIINIFRFRQKHLYVGIVIF
jgi:hypothetical protein